MDHGMDMNMPDMKPSGGEQKMPDMPGMQDGAKKAATPNKPAPHDMQNMPDTPKKPAQRDMQNMPGMQGGAKKPETPTQPGKQRQTSVCRTLVAEVVLLNLPTSRKGCTYKGLVEGSPMVRKGNNL